MPRSANHSDTFSMLISRQNSTIQMIALLLGSSMLIACTEEQPPRSANEFTENPMMLEAAMVRCAQDRSKTRYDAECVNARQAVRQIEAKEDTARKAEFEARSESKRKALRRTQQAATQARRRAAESERLREEAAYLAQFGVVLPDASSTPQSTANPGNTPQAVLPSALEQVEGEIEVANSENPPLDSQQPADDVRDLSSIRDELQRRAEEGGN